MNHLQEIGETVLLQHEGGRKLAALVLHGCQSLLRRLRTYVDLTLLGTHVSLTGHHLSTRPRARR